MAAMTWERLQEICAEQDRRFRARLLFSPCPASEHMTDQLVQMLRLHDHLAYYSVLDD